MDYLYKDLGNLKRGSTVIVTLRNQANVTSAGLPATGPRPAGQSGPLRRGP